MNCFCQRALLLTTAVLLGSCTNRSTNRIAHLDEAPADIVKELDTLPNTVLLATSRTVNAKDHAPPAPPTALKSCSTTTVYWVQVTYPITVCYPPSFSAIESAATVPAVNNSGATHRSIATHEYKLSGVAEQKFVSPWWCKRQAGPWIAEITERDSCSSGSTREYHLQILGIGQNVQYSWVGSLADTPSDLPTIGEPFVRNVSSLPCNAASTCGSSALADRP